MKKTFSLFVYLFFVTIISSCKKEVNTNPELSNQLQETILIEDYKINENDQKLLDSIYGSYEFLKIAEIANKTQGILSLLEEYNNPAVKKSTLKYRSNKTDYDLNFGYNLDLVQKSKLKEYINIGKIYTFRYIKLLYLKYPILKSNKKLRKAIAKEINQIISPSGVKEKNKNIKEYMLVREPGFQLPAGPCDVCNANFQYCDPYYNTCVDWSDVHGGLIPIGGGPKTDVPSGGGGGGDGLGGGGDTTLPEWDGDLFGRNGYETNYHAQRIIFKNVVSSMITDLEDEIYISFNLTSEQKALFADELFENNLSEVISNIPELENYLNTGIIDDGFNSWIRGMLRKYLGIDKPEDAVEAEEIRNEIEGWGVVGQFIRQLHDFWSSIFGFVPGYAALDSYMTGNYGAAGVNITLDMFGGGMIGFVAHGLQQARSFIKVSEMASHYPAVYSILRKINITEIQIIKGTAADKIIIIGENMKDRVLPFKAEFDKIFKPEIERFEMSQEAVDQLARLKNQLGRDLTLDELKTTIGYIKNKEWIVEKLNQGYGVIDIGSSNPNQIKSAFYGMEKGFVYPR